MGGGSWTKDSFASYSTSKGRSVSLDGAVTSSLSNQEMFVARKLDSALDPKNVIRECRDSEEHPNTVPIILALDVTGSMGSAAVEVAKKLNVIMTNLYDSINDVEFMIMGIGDLSCDDAPIQASQFESDIRIAEQLDKIYFEFGGGGNLYESYTAAWYFGSRHTDLDCWKRGQRGIIITMGDERINPYLPQVALNGVLGDSCQANIDTKTLYNEVENKFDIYHIDVNHGRRWDDGVDSSWLNVLDDKHYVKANLDNIADVITNIIMNSVLSSKDVTVQTGDGIVW